MVQQKKINEAITHINPFALLYFFTSVIVSGETVVPDQKYIGVFLQNAQIPTAIKTNPANTDAIEKYVTSFKNIFTSSEIYFSSSLKKSSLDIFSQEVSSKFNSSLQISIQGPSMIA